MYRRCNDAVSAIFQVFALTDAQGGVSFRALSPLTIADALGIEGSTRGRMQIMRVGEWKGHPAGPFKITAADLEHMLAQFNAQENPMVVDYDHSAPKRGDTRAAGWIHEMEIVGDWLWASDVEWTPKAAEAIRSGEFKFNSPWWDPDTKDRESGEPAGVRMMNVALTNMPFFDGQQPIMCSAIAADEQTNTSEAKPMDEFLAAVAKSSGLTPEAVGPALMAMADQIGAMLRDGATASVTAAEPAADADKDKPKDEPIAASTITAEQAAKIAHEAQIKGLLASVTALNATVGALVKEREDAKAAADAKLAAERTDRIASMVLDGRLGKDEQEAAGKLLAYDAALFESTYKDRKPTTPRTTQAGPEPKGKAPAADSYTEGFTASELVAFRSLTEGAHFTPDAARKGILAQRPVN